MKLIRRSLAANSVTHPKPSVRTNVYLFCERHSGAAHFQVEAGPDGELPVDHAAGLLAMHCMVRGHAPSDYMIMVQAPPESVLGLTEKASQLLEAGHSAKCAVKLTRREEEVLQGILKSLANKEIAVQLNLSERTVKFHVSSLLAKFKVRSRMELMREASQHSMRSTPAPLAVPAEDFSAYFPPAFSAGRNAGKVLPLARARMMA